MLRLAGVISRNFRKRTHERWKVEGSLAVWADVVLNAFGVLVTLLAVRLLIEVFAG